jgi:hypothetical protein
MIGSPFAYVGTELDKFANATNWKKYFSKKLRPYIGDNVIEVGAGLGSSTTFLCGGNHARWLCLDPDAGHVSRLKSRIRARELPPCCEARIGLLTDLTPGEQADTIIYIDVLEHIEHDEDEIRLAASHLAPGGHIVVLSPAFHFLYSPFDKAIGHYRRYTRQDARRLTLQSLTLQKTFFLDSAGFLASALNRTLLKKSHVSARDIRLWDKMIIPLSVLTDRVLSQLLGKSIVMVWRKS